MHDLKQNRHIIQINKNGGEKMIEKEKLMQMKSSVLRTLFHAELKMGSYYGEDTNLERAHVSSDKLGEIVNVGRLLAELAELLSRYDDFIVEQKQYWIQIKGCEKNNRRRKKEPREYLWLQYGEREGGIIMAAIAGGMPIYCNQIQLIDNLEQRLGMQLALLIQDDDTLKTFYLEYLKWLEPYIKQVSDLRASFRELVITDFCAISESFSEETAAVMPVRFNIPYLLAGIKRILDHYRVLHLVMPTLQREIGFQVQQGKRILDCFISLETYNAVRIYYSDHALKEEFCYRELNDRQTAMFICQLIHRMMREENPLGKLFAKDICDLVHGMLHDKPNLNETQVVAELESYIDTMML